MHHLIFAVVTAAAFQAQSPPDSRPNLVVFVGDDLGWRDTRPYGNAAVRTPNIERLARSGLLVRYAFGTSPQCSPSRISMLSGRYSHATRTEDLHTPLPPGQRLLPWYLRQQGYFTGHMAKTHYGPLAEKQFQWYAEQTGAAFSGFLDAAGDRPFFLWVGFHEPHRPYDSVPAPGHSTARVIVPPHLADTPETRTDIARYYDAIARMDSAIGEMMGELDRRRLRDSTLVVFLSDNGAPFPREKGTLYDSGTRTPLIFSWPAVIRAGQFTISGTSSPFSFSVPRPPTAFLSPTVPLNRAGVPLSVSKTMIVWSRRPSRFNSCWNRLTWESKYRTMPVNCSRSGAVLSGVNGVGTVGMCASGHE